MDWRPPNKRDCAPGRFFNGSAQFYVWGTLPSIRRPRKLSTLKALSWSRLSRSAYMIVRSFSRNWRMPPEEATKQHSVIQVTLDRPTRPCSKRSTEQETSFEHLNRDDS